MSETQTTPIPQVLGHLEHQLSREWLLTNGRGGFASGTAAGMNTRRYHGLLVAAARPPLERWMLLSTLLEKVTTRSQVRSMPDPRSVELANFQFEGVIHPRGYEHLAGFEARNDGHEPWAQFIYHLDGVRVRKRIVLPRGRDEVNVHYEVVSEAQDRDDARSCALCGHAGFSPSDPAIRGRVPGRSVQGGGHCACVARRAAGVAWGRTEDGQVMRFESRPDWWYGFFYREEAHRGQDCREDLFVPGWFRMEGPRADRVHVCCATLCLITTSRRLWRARRLETKVDAGPAGSAAPG